MKALTICQPFAHLITLPTDHPRHKRVENRSWPTRHRGLIYIHAGKSLRWLNDENGVDVSYNIRLRDMHFGAVVAIANLVDCVKIEDIEKGKYSKKYPWLQDHEHTEGPWCWILQDVTPIGPWPWRGAQGLFDIDSEALNDVATRLITADC